MHKKKIKTLKRRLFSSFGLSSIGFCLLLILLAYQIMSTTLVENAEKLIIFSTKSLSHQIESSNMEAVTVAMTMAMAQENGLFGNRTASISYAQQILKRNHNFTGAYFGYEINADQNDGKYLSSNQAEKKAMDKNGRFLPYWFVNHNNALNLELVPLIDMNTSLYYQGCKEKFYSDSEDKSMITEPYFYEGKMIVEQTFPIAINGKFVGIAGVDRSLADLDNLINEFKPYKTSKIILISRKGKIISSNMNLASKRKFDISLQSRKENEENLDKSLLNETMQTFSIENTDFKDILQNFYQMGENKSYTLIKEQSPLDGKEYYYSGSKIPAGDWTVVMQVAKSEILEQAYLVLFKIIVAAIAFTALLIFMVMRFSSKLTNILSKIVNASKELSKGHFNISLPRSSTVEIDNITVSLTETGKKLKALTQNIVTEKEQSQKNEDQFKNFFDILHNAITTKNYSTQVTLKSDKDIYALSINKVLDALNASEVETKEQDWLKTGRTDLSDAISGERKIKQLCKNAITYIAGYLNIQVGAIFVKDEEENDFRLEASYAFRHRKGLATRFRFREGFVGQAAHEKEKIIFSDIPEDYVRIESSFGSIIPKNILVVPFIFENEVQAVIELGAVFPFTKLMVEFVELSGSITAVAINAALSGEKLEKLLEQTNEQAQQLQFQQEELKKSNVELEEQAEDLRKSEAQLKIQQEELRATNEEMEVKNKLLETRQGEIEQKNLDLKKNQNEIEKKNLDLKKTQKEIETKNLDLEKTKADIEEKARQLELATQYKSEFLANMSHELRTPLNSMLLLAKMLSDNDEDNLSEDQIDSAASIHRSGQNLLRLINDILDLSKIEAKKIELSITNVNIEKFVSNLDIEFRHVAKEKGVKFTTHIEEGLPEIITTDILRLEQIVRNLLSNAYKFTEEGTVSVKFARPKESIRFDRNDLDHAKTIAVSVEDTGLGIPANKIEAIFEAFRQVDGSISRSHGGTGLGLSISRELSSLIGGELKVESTFGKGTVFTVYIPEILIAPNDDSATVPLVTKTSVQTSKKPVVKQSEISNAPVQKEQAQSAPTQLDSTRTISHDNGDTNIKQKDETSKSPPKIVGSGSDKLMLIVEEDNTSSETLENFFQKNGYLTLIASDGETGIKNIMEHKPAGVILSLELPGINGWAVLSELKNNPSTRHIPVYMMSATDNKRKCLQKGAVGHLTKPIDNNTLTKVLKKIDSILANDVKKLLIVEDDNDLRNTIIKLMKTKDINVHAVGTGKEALASLKEQKFDCIILDLGLPDIPGFELLDIINLEPKLKKIPVIIYTGRELTVEEAQKLEQYSASIVMKSVDSFERLLDETALFMHRVESDMPQAHQKMIQKIRNSESILKGKKVLLVDDDMRNIFALNKFLKSKGMITSVANNGQKALDFLAKEPEQDIVLMDIMMPVMDGYEAMIQIRKQDKFKNLPILALTAKAMGSDRDECIKCGANDYLSKPLDTTKLLPMLRMWLY